jgi:hypothetical protein
MYSHKFGIADVDMVISDCWISIAIIAAVNGDMDIELSEAGMRRRA